MSVTSDTGIVKLTPFQVSEPFSKNEDHIVGGVVINLGGDDKLIFVSSEFPNFAWGDRNEKVNSTIGHQYLIKVRPDDESVRVKPQKYHPDAGEQPYVLQNIFEGSIGLGINEKHLTIAEENGTTLIIR